jgi:ferredoxin-NADP reductase/ferredoxin
MPYLHLILPGISLLFLAIAAVVYLLTRRSLALGWRAMARADQAFGLRLRAARIRPPVAEEEEKGAWEGYRKFRIVKKVVEDGKQETASFYFSPIDGRRLTPFAPGAYLTIRVDIPDHGSESRAYSISGAFRQDYYRLSIKRVPGFKDKKSGKTYPPGLVSNFVHDHVHEGSTIDSCAPMCCPDFGLDMADDFPVVLFGGGVGVTPMLCMWEEIVQRQPTRPVWMFYGVRGTAEIMDNAGDDSALVNLSNQVSDDQRLFYCLSRVKEAKDDEGNVIGLTGGETEGDRMMCELFRRRLAAGDHPRIVYHHGRISVKSWVWDALTPRFQAEAHFYMCGPGAFMKALRVDLEAAGVPERRVHYEEFGADSHDAMTDVVNSKCEVTYSKGGRTSTASWEGWRRDLQRLAKANDVDIRGVCGVGACGDCETPILSGQVQHTRAPLPYEPTAGCCLPCVAVPHPDCEKLELQA